LIVPTRSIGSIVFTLKGLKVNFYSIAFKKIGDVWYGVALDDRRIVASAFSVEGRGKVVLSIMEHLPDGSDLIETKTDEYSHPILEALSEIYEGKPGVHDFKLAMDRLPPFTRRILVITSKIPIGFVATYGGIAKAAGNTRAARAVGNAEARNPFAPIIPCHRVVNSTLSLGGYGGGLDVKHGLLKREGVVFVGNRVSRECLWTPSE
jgi:methylated-DNA-[protein]-cysteine S-methyltransferase